MDIQTQADDLLYETGLMALLKDFGKVHPVGSYRMHMMSWNDLDISIENDGMTSERFYVLSYRINELLRPDFFEGTYRAERNTYFIGCETDLPGQRWNVDIWIHGIADILKTEANCDDISRLVAQEPTLGERILHIKKELMKERFYGMNKRKDKHYHSMDIYDAVLHKGVRTYEEFLQKHPL